MISYGCPICPITQNRAALFCYSDNCDRPAFGCTADCLISEGHSDHRTAEWSYISGDVRRAVELPLAKEELLSLEKQEKQIKIIADELRTIAATHEQSVAKCKKRLQLKQTAQTVFEAVQSRAANRLTGGDMARFVKAVQNSDLFQNKQSVGKAIQ